MPKTVKKLFGTVQFKKSEPEGSIKQVESTINEQKDRIEKLIAELCIDFLDIELVQLDSRYHTTPMNLDQFNDVLEKNYENI
jgi:replicative superfamily II helicase